MFMFFEFECMYLVLVLCVFEEFIGWIMYKFEENCFVFYRVFKFWFNIVYNYNIGIFKVLKCKLYIYFLEYINL